MKRDFGTESVKEENLAYLLLRMNFEYIEDYTSIGSKDGIFFSTQVPTIAYYPPVNYADKKEQILKYIAKNHPWFYSKAVNFIDSRIKEDKLRSKMRFDFVLYRVKNNKIVKQVPIETFCDYFHNASVTTPISDALKSSLYHTKMIKNDSSEYLMYAQRVFSEF
jgi:hypothetical protein